MSHFLHVWAGPYQLLLDAEGIHEVLDIESDETASLGCWDWRGSILPIVDMRNLCGVDSSAEVSPGRSGVVYSPLADAPPVVLQLDCVGRLRRAGREDFRPLPTGAKYARRFFDSVLRDMDSGTELYHLRRPLEREMLISEGSSLAAAKDQGEAAAVATVGQPQQEEPRRKRKGLKKRRS